MRTKKHHPPPKKKWGRVQWLRLGEKGGGGVFSILIGSNNSLCPRSSTILIRAPPREEGVFLHSNKTRQRHTRRADRALKEEKTDTAHPPERRPGTPDKV